MNWAYFALGIGGLISAVVVIGAVRRPGAKAGIALAIPLLVVATMNAAAPVRGAIDPAYMGYIFGLLRARMGLEVTFIAGTLLLLCAVSAYLSATLRSGRPLLLVAITCAALTIILGVPLVQGMITDPSANRIEFGEYLTIPGLLATAILLVVLVLPFAAGAVWAGRRATLRSA
jgi:hypothetical protein